MTTNYITIKGYLKDGKIEADLPDDAIEGEIELRVPVERDLPLDESAMKEDELGVHIEPEPLTGAEIIARGLTGGWEDLEITDSVAWVEEQKRKRRERHQWQSD